MKKLPKPVEAWARLMPGSDGISVHFLFYDEETALLAGLPVIPVRIVPILKKKRTKRKAKK